MKTSQAFVGKANTFVDSVSIDVELFLCLQAYNISECGKKLLALAARILNPKTKARTKKKIDINNFKIAQTF